MYIVYVCVCVCVYNVIKSVLKNPEANKRIFTLKGTCVKIFCYV